MGALQDEVEAVAGIEFEDLSGGSLIDGELEPAEASEIGEGLARGDVLVSATEAGDFPAANND